MVYYLSGMNVLTEKEWIGKESWRTDVFFALCDSLVEKSHTWPFKFAQMQPVISF